MSSVRELGGHFWTLLDICGKPYSSTNSSLIGLGEHLRTLADNPGSFTSSSLMALDGQLRTVADSCGQPQFPY